MFIHITHFLVLVVDFTVFSQFSHSLAPNVKRYMINVFVKKSVKSFLGEAQHGYS